MKKMLPYALSLFSVVLLVVLGYRWYSQLRSANEGQISTEGEGIEITDLTGSETPLRGVEDVKTVTLAPQPESNAMGQLRIASEPQADGKTPFSIYATLPAPTDPLEFYQLWIEGSTGMKKAMKLKENKAGYFAEGLLSVEGVQAKILISSERKDDDEMETKLLEGTVDLQQSEE